MKGIVIMANHHRGMYAVQVEGGDITVIELLGSPEPNPGDILIGGLDDSCTETLYNQTQGEEIDITIQALGCSPQSARQLLAG